MASDPRERIETEHLRCVRRREVTRTELFQIRDSDQFALTYTDWPELVAFAKAILAADSEWQDSQAPTLEELRERYPGNRPEMRSPDCRFKVSYRKPPGMTYTSWATERRDALRWLAAELAKHGEDTKNG